MKSKYKTYSNASIVTVVCGSDQGTAFFVKNDELLTARHVLADAEENDDDVLIKVGARSYACSIVWQGDSDNMVDLALLKCDGYVCPSPLRLLALPPDRRNVDLTVCGFPHETGGGYNQFEIPVSPIACVENREYDVITAPLSLLSFVSFKGFSGSPVLNDSGSVVGVITDQLNAVLGFKSIASVFDLLAEQGLTCSTDWELEDKNPYGLGHALQLVEKQIDLAGDRYCEEVHVDNVRLMEELEFCTNKQNLNATISQLTEIEKSYFEYAATLPEDKQIKDWDGNKYEAGSFLTIVYFLQKAQKIAEKDLQAKKSGVEQNLKKAITDADECVKQYLKASQSVILIEGAAGSGKTHMMCRFARHHQSECYVYVIHGAQLAPSRDIEEQICHLCQFPDNSLAELNNMMASVDKYGVVIIDAINECSSGSYWVGQLDAFRQTFENYPFLKLILTVRSGTVPIPSEWVKQLIYGFDNVYEAVGKYFKKYGISTSLDWKKFKGDFYNPLFLRLFCESYRYLNYGWQKNLKQIDVYLAHIKKRNVKISELVDEDMYNNVTEKYLLKLASYSLYYKYCQDIGRDKARQCGDSICRGRAWSQSLLRNCLNENLLISMPNFDDENETVGYHFEKMGDFLRAYVLSTAERSLESKLDQLLLWQKKQVENEEYEGRFKGLIGAFVDTYNGEEDLLQYHVFTEGPLRPFLVEALPYNTKYNTGIVKLLLKSVSPELVRALVLRFNDYGGKEIVTLRNELLSMTMPERDLVWSEAVNRFYDSYKFDFGDWCWDVREKKDRERALVLLSWLLCSSYPDVRWRIIRRIFSCLKEKTEFCTFLLKATAACNDPYVVEGVLCAVFGVVVMSRDAVFVSNVANLVRQIYYPQDGICPLDIQIRKWVLQIFERDQYLTPSSKHFTECTPPYSTPNPFEYLKANVKAMGSKDFFGKTWGSQKIYSSLFDLEDFARYIIGTNGSPNSRVFIYKNSDDGVPLSDIQEMIAQRIMELGWNDELGEYDNARYSKNRHENLKERLGKKYQWIAYREVLGMLSDHCRMKDRWSTTDKKYDKNYPWYSEGVNRFDPTLRRTVEIINKLDWKSPFDFENRNAYQWVKDDASVPVIKFEFKDKDGEVWVVLNEFDYEEVKQNEYEVVGFLYFNPHFVKAGDVDTVVAWAGEQNFYGRWVNEAPELYQFLWNEYPWSDNYKNTVDWETWENLAPSENGGVDSMRATLIQLQEDNRGLGSESYLSNVYLPCEDMMSVLGLYTAERGIIRDASDNEIVAASLEQLGVSHNGLAIKKKYLEQYLAKSGNVLFYFILGEKHAKVSMTITNDGIKQMSSCWYIDGDGEHEVQPIAVRKEEPSQPKEEGERSFEWLDQFIKDNPDFSIGDVEEGD